MNFQDLLTKMKQLDECGEMMPHPPAQNDSVNMNVTMSGSGSSNATRARGRTIWKVGGESLPQGVCTTSPF